MKKSPGAIRGFFVWYLSESYPCHRMSQLLVFNRLTGGRIFLLAASVLFVALSLVAIDTWPLVGEDESWTAAAPFKLATEGIYASDLFAGYHGSEQGLYHLNPLYHCMLAGVFKLAGAGVVQMRLLPVLFGLMVLLLVHHISRALFGQREAMVAVGLLLLLRLVAPEYGTGIPLFDIAHTNRPDIAVPAFGLAAFAFFLSGETSGQIWRYLVCGLLIGLASLAHLYGAFWLPALLTVLVLRHGLQRPMRIATVVMIAGFAVPWIPVLIWLASGWDSFIGQSQLVAARFDVLSPAFYLHNLLHEYQRFGVLHLLKADGGIDWFRPGAWSTIIGAPLALVVMLRQRNTTRSDTPFTLAIVLTVQAVLFALLINIKFFNYFIALWPIVVFTLAWLSLYLWNRWQQRWARSILIALLALIGIEGAIRIAGEQVRASVATPYNRYEQRIAAHLPDNARVIGLNRYWLGLRQYDYRSWLVPILLSDSLYTQRPVTLDSALERIAPYILLIDRDMRRYLDEIADPANPRHNYHIQLQRYLQRHGARQEAEVVDRTYGTMEIIRISH
jgi:4-amino-4-deoxy-L-arabinose transferase-like glycosyltransferase